MSICNEANQNLPVNFALRFQRDFKGNFQRRTGGNDNAKEREDRNGETGTGGRE